MRTATQTETHQAILVRRIGEDRVARPATDTRPYHPSATALWSGRILSGLALLFLTFDATVKLLKLPFVVEVNAQLGYPESVIVAIGLIEVVCLVAYLIPGTAVLGAVLWTGYLGGAVATHVRVGSPLVSHTLFPIFVAAFLWGGLWLRDPRVRALLPTRATD